MENVYWDLDGTLRPKPNKTLTSIRLALREKGIDIEISKQDFSRDWNLASIKAKEKNDDVYKIYISELLKKFNLNQELIQSLANRAKELTKSFADSDPFDYTKKALELVKNANLNNIIITHSTRADEWLNRFDLRKAVNQVIDNIEVKHPYFSKSFIYIADQESDIKEYELAVKNGKSGVLYIVNNKYNYPQAIYVENALEAAKDIIKNIKKISFI